MNVFRKIYYRTYQFVFNLVLPFMPFRKPKILSSNDEVVDVLKKNKIFDVLIVTDKGIRDVKLIEPLVQVLEDSNIKYVIYDRTVPNPTSENVEEALSIYKEHNLNGIIAIGGGSPIDLAKAVGARYVRPNKSLRQLKGLLHVRKKLPLFIAIPTTSGTGSEVTVASIITDSETHIKYAINDFALIPHYAVLDYKLTLNLPPHITSTTGMDALTHAIEAYINNAGTKKTKKMSLESVKMIVENLKTCYLDPLNIEARRKMLYASHFAGISFTRAYVGYVHAIAHALGGKYNIPHGLANAVILPIILEEYGSKVYIKLAKLARYSKLTCSKNDEEAAKILISWIYEANKEMNIPSSFSVILDSDISYLAKLAAKEANPLYPVPKLMGEKELIRVIKRIKNC